MKASSDHGNLSPDQSAGAEAYLCRSVFTLERCQFPPNHS